SRNPLTSPMTRTGPGIAASAAEIRPASCATVSGASGAAALARAAAIFEGSNGRRSVIRAHYGTAPGRRWDLLIAGRYRAWVMTRDGASPPITPPRASVRATASAGAPAGHEILAGPPPGSDGAASTRKRRRWRGNSAGSVIVARGSGVDAGASA